MEFPILIRRFLPVEYLAVMLSREKLTHRLPVLVCECEFQQAAGLLQKSRRMILGAKENLIDEDSKHSHTEH